MISVLVVDDDVSAGQFTKIKLEQAFRGATVEVVPGQTCEDFVNGLRRNLQMSQWDFLVLDILYLNEKGPRKDWGGMFVFNQLVAEGLRGRWKDTVVATKHYREGVMVNYAGEIEGPGLSYRDQKSVEEFILYLFAATAGIPTGSNGLVLPVFTNDRDLLVARIGERI